MERKDNKVRLQTTNFNAEPVVYCKKCLSLKIMVLDEDNDYCDNCGCTDTATTDIYTWEKLYKEKYGKSFK